MNKLLYTALGLSVIAFICAVSVTLAPKNPSLGGYNPPVQSSSGFTQSLSVSSTLAASSFCNPANLVITGSAANTTTTLPAATSTYGACANYVNFGSSVSGLIVNDSTNTANFAAGTGDTVKCETSGVGTTTILGICSATGFSMTTSTVINYTIYFDTTSSTLVFSVGNNYK